MCVESWGGDSGLAMPRLIKATVTSEYVEVGVAKTTIQLLIMCEIACLFLLYGSPQANYLISIKYRVGVI